ncbi:uncharacterized protein BT62DRAFT_934826 [Guyanagaster necrorhizus]|uniref:Uncharacterized protein n=1 Tax=Guyanagaster necrorhizus TaxID=856835 RepID=A0A9P7VN36_9AGAR|nr:uncharacterized protein BT62DRAFT_934826 [Guyanagaster necrorhizus MCA 3950]KAG7443590.1 hypothetical protein BT62DRAFT_934826 [Guyanagaster necrorhizus MCA 3950]
MSQYSTNGDVFGSSSQFLSPPKPKALYRKSPSRQSLNPRRSTASLRSTSNLAHAMDDDTSNSRYSLAHELAVALMPEPSAGSMLLAEEFGIEYDEGAEGIDKTLHHDEDMHLTAGGEPLSLASESESDSSVNSPFDDGLDDIDDSHSMYNPIIDSPSANKHRRPEKKDAMEILSENLESTDKFLSHLRHIDVDMGPSASQQPTLEKIATDVIRRINDTVRDREGQVRELLEYERELRKIAGEVGGNDVLGQLEEFTPPDDLVDGKPPVELPHSGSRHLDIVEEEHFSNLSNSSDWDMDPDHRHLGDYSDDESDTPLSPLKDSFPLPPTVNGPATPAVTIPQLAHLRSFTSSLVSSLSTISEQAQVNGAATTEAGRKIRALKNKLGGWRTEWDSAERSRRRIERWEAGIVDGPDSSGENTPVASPMRTNGMKRADGRQIVREHLDAFQLALTDAGMKTQAIMAS